MCLKRPISFRKFIKEIVEIKQIEFYCAKTNNKIEKHRKKWKFYKSKENETCNFVRECIDKM